MLFWRCFLREEYSGSKPGSLSCTRSTTTLRLTAYLVHCCGNIMQARPGSHTRRRGPDHRCVLCERGPRQPSRTCPDQPIDRSLLVCVCVNVFSPSFPIMAASFLPSRSLSLSLPLFFSMEGGSSGVGGCGHAPTQRRIHTLQHRTAGRPQHARCRVNPSPAAGLWTRCPGRGDKGETVPQRQAAGVWSKPRNKVYFPRREP